MRLNKGIAKAVRVSISKPLTRLAVKIISGLRLTESGSTRITETGLERTTEE